MNESALPRTLFWAKVLVSTILVIGNWFPARRQSQPKAQSLALALALA
jgi:hypothetical protein